MKLESEIRQVMGDLEDVMTLACRTARVETLRQGCLVAATAKFGFKSGPLFVQSCGNGGIKAASRVNEKMFTLMSTVAGLEELGIMEDESKRIRAMRDKCEDMKVPVTERMKTLDEIHASTCELVRGLSREKREVVTKHLRTLIAQYQPALHAEVLLGENGEGDMTCAISMKFIMLLTNYRPTATWFGPRFTIEESRMRIVDVLRELCPGRVDDVMDPHVKRIAEKEFVDNAGRPVFIDDDRVVITDADERWPD